MGLTSSLSGERAFWRRVRRFATRRKWERENMASSSSRMELEKMGIEQLKALKEQADLEVNLLQDSLNNIRTATGRLDSAAAALNDLSLRPQGPLEILFHLSFFNWSSAVDDFEKLKLQVRRCLCHWLRLSTCLGHLMRLIRF